MPINHLIYIGIKCLRIFRIIINGAYCVLNSACSKLHSRNFAAFALQSDIVFMKIRLMAHLLSFKASSISMTTGEGLSKEEVHQKVESVSVHHVRLIMIHGGDRSDLFCSSLTDFSTYCESTTLLLMALTI